MRINPSQFNIFITPKQETAESKSSPPLFQFAEIEQISGVDNGNSTWKNPIETTLADAVDDLGISSYTYTKLNGYGDAVQKSQEHLFDLIRLYEGNRKNNYEPHTVPYDDGGKTPTCGFGELTNKPISKPEAYEHMTDHFRKNADELKDILGENVYNNLPDSIKEGLLDLCYNKGKGTVRDNAILREAIVNKDWATVIENLVFVKYNNPKSPKYGQVAPGLYPRSLSRAILAARDVNDSEVDKAIDRIYNEAINVEGVDRPGLDKIYNTYKKNLPTDFGEDDYDIW